MAIRRFFSMSRATAGARIPYGHILAQNRSDFALYEIANAGLDARRERAGRPLRVAAAFRVAANRGLHLTRRKGAALPACSRSAGAEIWNSASPFGAAGPKLTVSTKKAI
jgi:hypothetical protein